MWLYSILCVCLCVLNQGALFVALVCFAVTIKPTYVAATGLEFLITALMVLFYILKLNKTITFFFWPLVVSDAVRQPL